MIRANNWPSVTIHVLKLVVNSELSFLYPDFKHLCTLKIVRFWWRSHDQTTVYNFKFHIPVAAVTTKWKWILRFSFLFKLCFKSNMKVTIDGQSIELLKIKTTPKSFKTNFHKLFALHFAEIKTKQNFERNNVIVKNSSRIYTWIFTKLEISFIA